MCAFEIIHNYNKKKVLFHWKFTSVFFIAKNKEDLIAPGALFPYKRFIM